MAPETIMGKGSERPVDWWSLGVLLYELIYNKLPFYDEDVQAMYIKTIIEKVSFPAFPPISDVCKNFIRKLLMKSPRKRLGSEADTLEIMNHSFFSKFNWFKLLGKSLKPPYSPIRDNENWLNNFGTVFVSQKPIDSICIADSSLLKKYEKEFSFFNS